MRIGNWEIVKTIGAGRWAEIGWAKPHGCQSNNADYVIKFVPPESANFEFAGNMLIRELACSRLVSHPTIISFLDGSPQHSIPYLVSARHRGEPLQYFKSHVGRIVELGQKLTCFRQICEGLQNFHRMGIRHGDISPSNILFDFERTQTLLVDLGLSEKVRPFCRESDFIAGTWGYVAPECIQGELPVNLSADIYSLGITMKEFTANQAKPLPRSKTHFSLIRQELENLLSKMTAHHPLKRPTISEVGHQVAMLEIGCLEVDYRAAS